MCVASAHADSPIGEYALVTSKSAFCGYLYMRKAVSFQQWKVFDFSKGVYGGRGVWTFVMNMCFICEINERDLL